MSAGPVNALPVRFDACLEQSTERFEETHPNLTLAIGAVADALSRLGI